MREARAERSRKALRAVAAATHSLTCSIQARVGGGLKRPVGDACIARAGLTHEHHSDQERRVVDDHTSDLLEQDSGTRDPTSRTAKQYGNEDGGDQQSIRQSRPHQVRATS